LPGLVMTTVRPAASSSTPSPCSFGLAMASF
jgi:hypothetical protein